MKKIILVLLVVLGIFLFVACDDKGIVIDDNNQTITEEGIKGLDLVSALEIADINGFDYSVAQTYKKDVVNSHSIKVRLNHGDEIIGSREEKTKNLNDEITDEQYIETTVNTYFKNDKIATLNDETWTWSDGSLKDFIGFDVSAFKFDKDKLTNVNLKTVGNNNVLTFGMSDSNAAAFLGVSQEIKDFAVDIKFDSDATKLISMKMSYSQNLTKTEYNFVPVYTQSTIELPD